MPWSHCGVGFILDTERCPECGTDKTAWTLKVEQTRTFMIGGGSKGKAWIDIELHDPRGKPRAGAAYRVRFANGRTRQGQLDAEGLARVKRPFPGLCAIEFPDRELETITRVEAGTTRAPAPRPAYTWCGLEPPGAEAEAKAKPRPRPLPLIARLRGHVRAGHRGALQLLKAARRHARPRPARSPRPEPRRPSPADAALELTQAQCARDGGTHYLFRESRDPDAKTCLPLRVTFRSREQARAWLARNPIQVYIDAEQVPCGAVVRGRDRIEVQFRIPPGEHRVLVCSQPAGRGPRRVFLTQRVEVA